MTKTFKEYREEKLLVIEAIKEGRCTLHTTNAILSHHGKPLATVNDNLFTGADVMDHLKGHDLKPSRNMDMDIRTLHDAVTRLPKHGAYQLSSTGHSMAFVDGKLTDTNPTSTPKRRQVTILQWTKRDTP